MAIEPLPHADPPLSGVDGGAEEGPAGVPFGSSVTFRMRRKAPHTAIVSVSGDLDRSDTPRFHELLSSRLQSEIELLAVDLSGVTFFSGSALAVLMNVDLQAQLAGVELRVVPGSSQAARRALALAESIHPVPVTADAETSRDAATRLPRIT
jgi:anti-anti-sigma factor